MFFFIIIKQYLQVQNEKTFYLNVINLSKTNKIKS